VKLAVVLLLAAASLARWVPFETFRLQPVDEADRVASFSKFRYDLSRALESRDAKKLLPLVSDDVALSVLDKGKHGKSVFISEWRLVGSPARESKLWDALREVVRLGGSFEDGEFHAPYVFSRWPGRFPHLDFYAVTVKKCPVYVKPDENSREVANLSEEIVGRFDENPNPPGWKAVRTSTGVTGFLRADDVRSPLDYRAIFKREKTGWKLALFASGDWETHERPE
jgi:hypothetical protein